MKSLVYTATIVVLVIGAVAVGKLQVAEARTGKLADERTRPAGAQACTPPPSGIVAWYRGEDNGLDVFDLNDATLLNGAGYTAGKVGRALTFDGVNDYAYVPNTASQNFGTGDFSVEYWVKFDDLTTNTNGFLTKDDYTGGVNHKGWLFNIADSIGGIGFEVRNIPAGSDNSARWATSNFSTGTWYHLAGIRRSGVIEFYVNGILRGSATETVPTDVSNNYELRIGALSDGDTQNFAGQIDEPALYNRALSLSEVQSIYNTDSAGKCLYCTPAPVGMASWYQAENDSNDVRSRMNGTPQGGIGYAPGKIGQAFSFDGVDDSVDIGTGIATQDFSLSMWVKPGATQVQYADIVDNNHTQFQNWVIQQTVSNTNVYAFSGTTDFPLAPNVWQHLVVTHDSANNSRAYVDGVLVASGIYAIPYNGTQFLRLGRWAGGGRNWNGQMDEFATFDRALTPIEVRNMYQAGGNGLCRPTATTPPSGVVGWWGGDGDALDASGNGNNGSIQNGASFGVDKVGQGFVFDGVDDHVFVPANSTLNVGAGGGLTVEAWVNPANSDQQPFFEWNGGGPDLGNLGAHLWMSVPGGGDVTNNMHGNLVDTSNISHVIRAPGVIVPGQWQHVALTYDKAGGGNAVIYFNGAPVATSNLGVFTPRTFTNLYLGHRPGSVFLNGRLDEPTIYSRALSQPEIQSIVNAGLGGKLKTINSASGPFSLWKGETTANDSIGTNHGSANNGTLYSAGITGQSFAFDGADDEVSVPDAANLNFGTNWPMSIELWAYRTSSSVLQHMMGKRPGCTVDLPNYQIAYANSQVYFGSGAGNEVGSGIDLPLNTWTHIAATFDGTTNRVYMNGFLAASAAGTRGPATSAPLRIGTSGTCSQAGTSFGGRLDDVATFDRALSANEILRDYQSQSNSSNKLGDVSLAFPNLTTPGITQQIPLDPALLPPLPAGATPGLTYDIDTSAWFTGNVNLCFNVPALATVPASDLRIFHMENGAWVNRTALGGTYSALCTTGVTSLSPFAVARLIPTSANASLSGRAVSATGQGIRNAVITLTDPSGHSRTARTASFGFYRFDDVAVGGNYVLTINSKRFTFIKQTRIISVTDDVVDADFTAIE